MNWNSWNDFFAMGGHGLYVWGSLGMCAAGIAAEVVLLRLRRQALRADNAFGDAAGGEFSA